MEDPAEVALLCKILNLDEDTYASQFSVKKSKSGPSTLRIGHFLDSANLSDPIVAAVRGVIFDASLEMLIASTNYRSTIARGDHLEIDADGKIPLATEFGQRYLEKDLVEILPFEEGYAIRVFRWNGKTEFASSKSLGIQGTPRFDDNGHRILPNKNASRWGHYLPFVTQLNALLKLSEEDYDATDALFPVGCNYSPFVYVFYVTHKSRLQDTGIDVNDFGFVCFIGAFLLWSYIDKNLRLTDEMIGVKHETPTSFEGTYTKIPSTADSAPFMLANRESLNLDEVNNVLRYGVPAPTQEIVDQTNITFGIDPRLTSGESVRIRYWNEEKGVPEFFHVQSNAYRARHERHSVMTKINGNEIRQNLPNQYKCAVTDFVDFGKLKVVKAEDRARFVEQIVPVRPSDYLEAERVLLDDQIITSADVYTDAELAGLGRMGLEEIINYYRVLIANPSHQLEELLYLRRFRTDWNFLLRWLFDRKNFRGYRVKSNPAHAEADQRVYDSLVMRIFKEAATQTAQRWEKFQKWHLARMAKHPEKKRRPVSREMFNDEQIKRIVARCNGREIYALFRLCRHDTKTDSKSIADMTATMIPKTNFPSLKTKSKKTPKKSTRTPVSLPSNVASSSTSTITDMLSQFG